MPNESMVPRLRPGAGLSDLALYDKCRILERTAGVLNLMSSMIAVARRASFRNGGGQHPSSWSSSAEIDQMYGPASGLDYIPKASIRRKAFIRAQFLSSSISPAYRAPLFRRSHFLVLLASSVPARPTDGIGDEKVRWSQQLCKMNKIEEGTCVIVLDAIVRTVVRGERVREPKNCRRAVCGVRVKAFSRAPPGPTREPDQDFTSSVLGPTITLSITARGSFIEKEWRRTNFVTFLRLIFERVGTIDIAWEWLRDSYLARVVDADELRGKTVQGEWRAGTKDASITTTRVLEAVSSGAGSGSPTSSNGRWVWGIGGGYTGIVEPGSWPGS
ncbi:hypothetical protein C8R43DRAFT_957838 [Mycena crocata]|nr:hypothetical protein C8R43DRAFT_957838 [Mycena crocata]